MSLSTLNSYWNLYLEQLSKKPVQTKVGLQELESRLWLLRWQQLHSG
jgi:hypothetical protein